MLRWTFPLQWSLLVAITIGLNSLDAQEPWVPPQPQQPTPPKYFPRPAQSEDLLREMREWQARQLAIIYSHHEQMVVPPYVLLVPVVPYEPAQHPPYPMPFYPPPAPDRAAHLPRRVMNNHGIGCKANCDGACGNLHSEMRFIFGSCRSFFGEACVPNERGAAHR